MQTKLENLCQTKSCASLSKYFFFFSKRVSFEVLHHFCFFCPDLGIWNKRTKGVAKWERERLPKAVIREAAAAKVWGMSKMRPPCSETMRGWRFGTGSLGRTKRLAEPLQPASCSTSPFLFHPSSFHPFFSQAYLPAIVSMRFWPSVTCGSLWNATARPPLPSSRIIPPHWDASIRWLRPGWSRAAPERAALRGFSCFLVTHCVPSDQLPSSILLPLSRLEEICVPSFQLFVF